MNTISTKFNSSQNLPTDRDIYNEPTVTEHNWTAVNKVGIAYCMGINAGRRMEDEHNCVDGYLNDPQNAYFGIYDGHGGRKVATHVMKNLPDAYANQLSLNDEENIWKAAYTMLHAEVTHKHMYGGTTVVSVVIKYIDGQRCISCANAGDARAIAIKNGLPVRLSHDHKPYNEDELKRIATRGGFVMAGRLNGVLAVSRAIGDAELSPGISCDPYVSVTPIGSELSHIVLACDGVWDVLSDADVSKIVLDNVNDLDAAAKIIVTQSLSSKDNITCIVVAL